VYLLLLLRILSNLILKKLVGIVHSRLTLLTAYSGRTYVLVWVLLTLHACTKWGKFRMPKALNAAGR